MTKPRLADDLPRVLPADPSWIADSSDLVLELQLIARAAQIRRPGTYLLDYTAYWIAGETVDRIRSEAMDVAASRIALMSLPAYQLQAVQRVRAAVQRALDLDPDAERLLDIMQHLRVRPGDTPTGLALDLDRILAVLALDVPAVHTLAAAHFTDLADPAWQAAYEQITAAWRAAGIRC